MPIDIFAHIMPPEYVRKVLPHTSKATQAFAAGTPALGDLEARQRVMDRFPEVRQVLTLAGPIEPAGPFSAAQVATIANDSLADLVARHPDRFCAAAAALPLDDPEAALEEADRALRDLHMRGVELFTPAGTRPLDGPEFDPLYRRMCEHDLPIWIHPRRELTPDYPGEERSKFRIFGLWGWPYETTVAMTRLVLSGVLDRFPGIKFITHHAGGMVPFFSERISTWYDYLAGPLRTDYRSAVRVPLLDAFRRFYGDTALNGNTAGLACAHAFFGADHILFGTDMPFDDEGGARSVRETLRSVAGMDVTAEVRNLILEGNARRLLRLES